jgi:uncharacterized protein (TIGR01777 family)
MNEPAKNGQDMKIAVAGARGFIGSNLCPFLIEKGYRVIAIRREDLQMQDEALANVLEGVDVVINLSGSPILARWTRKNRQIMYDSRVLTTRRIIEALRKMRKQPDVFISVSAVGIYNQSDSHDEFSQHYASDELGNIVYDWEREIHLSTELGIRTIIFRLGIVLGKNGGAFPRILRPYRFGLGGPVGSGTQPFPFVYIDDVLEAFHFVILKSSMKGIYNLVAPQQVTSRELSHTIGEIMRRPSFFRVPSFLLYLMFGKGAIVLTKGQRVIPGRLVDEGYNFRFQTIRQCVEELLSS